MINILHKKVLSSTAHRKWTGLWDAGGGAEGRRAGSSGSGRYWRSGGGTTGLEEDEKALFLPEKP